MVTRDVHSYFIRKKAEKKDLQVQIPQLVKTADNVIVAINTELKNSYKERKNTKLTCVPKSKTKLVNRHRDMEYRRQLHTFLGTISTLKRTTVNNWKRQFSNPQKEVGEPPE